MKQGVELVHRHHDERQEEQVKTQLLSRERHCAALDPARLLRLRMAVKVRPQRSVLAEETLHAGEKREPPGLAGLQDALAQRSSELLHSLKLLPTLCTENQFE